jgi:Zn-dependent protease
MVLFTLRELFDLILMTVVLGYIFLPSIQRPRAITEMFTARLFNWQDFRFALIVTAPAVVLHELMHKFAALFLGLAATFHASYFGLGLGLFLRVIQSPFIVFIPGYVSISAAPPLASAFTAFMGPLTNLMLFCVAALVLKRAKKLKRNHIIFLALTKQINLFLFLFNMIPIPPFDGSHVVSGLFQAFF